MRLALHRRVAATRARKHVLADRLKRWWRRALFRSSLRGRLYWQRARREQERFVFATASRLQVRLWPAWKWFPATPVSLTSRRATLPPLAPPGAPLARLGAPVLPHPDTPTPAPACLQRFFHQKRMEYQSAGRVAARVQIQRRLEREEVGRVWARRDGAARTVQKVLRGHALSPTPLSTSLTRAHRAKGTAGPLTLTAPSPHPNPHRTLTAP